MKLDGTEALKPTPYDAHEQIVRGPHTHVSTKNATVEAHEAAGYKADPDFEPGEYPKVVAYSEPTDAFRAHGEPIVANDAAHEEELLEQLEAAKKEK